MPFLDSVARAKNKVQDAFAPKKDNWGKGQPPTGPPGQEEEKSFARKALGVGGKAVVMGGKAVYKGGKAVGGAVLDKADSMKKRRAKAKADAEAEAGEQERKTGPRGALSKVGGTVTSGVGKVKAIVTRTGDKTPAPGHTRTESGASSPGSPRTPTNAVVEFRNQSSQTVTVVMEGSMSQSVEGGARIYFYPPARADVSFEVRDVIGLVLGEARLSGVTASAAFTVSENLCLRRLY